MTKTDFSITVKHQDKCLIYTEASAPCSSPRVYVDDNNIVFEIWVDKFDYEFKVRDGVAVIIAKEAKR